MEAEEDERVAELRLQIREKYGYKKRDLSRGWDSIGQDFAGVSTPTTRVLSKANNSCAPAFATPIRGGVKNERNENYTPKSVATRSEPRAFPTRQAIARTSTPRRNGASCIRTGVVCGKSSAPSSTLKALDISSVDFNQVEDDSIDDGNHLTTLSDNRLMNDSRNQSTQVITPTGLTSVRNDKYLTTQRSTAVQPRSEAARDWTRLPAFTSKDSMPSSQTTTAQAVKCTKTPIRLLSKTGHSSLSDEVSPRIKSKLVAAKSPGRILTVSDEDDSLEQFLSHVSAEPCVKQVPRSIISAIETSNGSSPAMEDKRNSIVQAFPLALTQQCDTFGNSKSFRGNVSAKRQSWSKSNYERKRAPKRPVWTKNDFEDGDESFEIDDDTDTENTPKKRKSSPNGAADDEADNQRVLADRSTVCPTKKQLKFPGGEITGSVTMIDRERLLPSEEERIPLAAIMAYSVGPGRKRGEERGDPKRADPLRDETPPDVGETECEDSRAGESGRNPHPFARNGQESSGTECGPNTEAEANTKQPTEIEPQQEQRQQQPPKQTQPQAEDSSLDISIVSSSSQSSPVTASSKLSVSCRQMISTSRYAAPDPNEKKLRRKYKKGGLAERLAKITNRERSEIAFWAHKIRKANGNVSSKIKSMKVQVLCSPTALGCVFLVNCRQVLDEADATLGPVVQVAFSRESVDALKIRRGSVVIICEPWRSVTLEKPRDRGITGCDDESIGTSDSLATELIYTTNYCFSVSSTDMDMTGLGQQDYEEGDEDRAPTQARIWRDIVSEIYASEEEGASDDVVPEDTPLPVANEATNDQSLLTSTVARAANDESKSHQPTSSTRLLSPQKLPFLPSVLDHVVEESVPIPAEVAFFSQIRPSFSPALTQRHNLTVCAIYAIPPIDNGSSSSTTTYTQLYCLDASSSVAVVRVCVLDSFAPSVLSALQSRRRLLLRLEGLILFRRQVDTLVIDSYACVMECSPSDASYFPFSVAEASRRISAFDVTNGISAIHVSDLFLFTGRILEIDFDNAFSERVCPDCSSPVDDNQGETEDERRRRIFCSDCNKGVVPIDRVTMHIFVEQRRRNDNQNESSSSWKVKIMLTSDFAQQMLPPVREGEDHYDPDQVLSQPLERLPCLVDNIDRDAKLIVLQQVELFSGLS